MIGTFKLPVTAGGSTSGDYLVRFIDFDGTILKEQWVNEGQAATAPTVPTHDLLTFDEWNNDFSNITGDLDVGATYRTTTGHSYLFLSFTVPHRLTPSLYLNKSTTDVLNVYDNTSGALLGTSSASGNVTINLTFEAVGDYVIRIECAGVYTFQSYLFGNGLNYELILRKVFIGDSVQSIGNYTFYNCYALQSVVIPSSVTSIGTYAFYYCSALQSVVIPSSVTSIGNYTFYNCSALQSVVIPSSVTSIDTYAFYYCTKMQEYIFEPTTPPTLASTNAFTGIIAVCKIYVPDASVDAYKAATNWATYAAYIFPLSTRP